MPKKKEEKKINPIMEDNTDVLVDPKIKEGILQDLQAIKEKYGGDKDKDIESFFTEVLKQLLNKDNISLKTEYLNVNENFAGVRLEFLSRFANMPYLHDFIDIFEQKRVSLERKSRKEIVMVLEKREQEVQRQEMKDARQNMFGYA